MTTNRWAQSRPECSEERTNLPVAMVRMPRYHPMTRNDSRAEERTLEATAAIHEIEQSLWAQWRLELTEDVIHPPVRIPRYPKVVWKYSIPRNLAYKQMATRLAIQAAPATTRTIMILWVSSFEMLITPASHYINVIYTGVGCTLPGPAAITWPSGTCWAASKRKQPTFMCGRGKTWRLERDRKRGRKIIIIVWSWQASPGVRNSPLAICELRYLDIEEENNKLKIEMAWMAWIVECCITQFLPFHLQSPVDCTLDFRTSKILNASHKRYIPLPFLFRLLAPYSQKLLSDTN